MLEFLRKWIVNLSAITLLIVLVEMIVPSGKTKKMICLVTGFILILAIAAPFLKLLGYKDHHELNLLRISGDNFIDEKEMRINSKLYEEEQSKQITEVYRKKLIERLGVGLGEIEEIGSVKTDLMIEENAKSEQYGQIKRVYIYLLPKDTKQGSKQVVDPIKIKIDSESQPTGECTAIDPKLLEKVTKETERLLEIKKEQIVIALMEQ